MLLEKPLLDDAVLAELVRQSRRHTKEGTTADYIPLLKEADPSKLGICAIDTAGHKWKAGDTDIVFSMQSIVKILTLTCSLLDSGREMVAKKVSVEPSGESFNSITSLETKNNSKPLNPMINAGSIASLTLVAGDTLKQKSERVLEFTRKLAGNPGITVDSAIYKSEKQTGERNRALAYYMKSTGAIDADIRVEQLLNAYFRTCSISVTCEDLARIALVYAENGRDPLSGEIYFPPHIARFIKATMVMCGMYDESGRVAVQIGLPTKSGVGGGILSIVPGSLGIGIYGPALNDKGSSAAGLVLLEKLSGHLDASIF